MTKSTVRLAIFALLCVSMSLCDLDRGLTSHFQDWLKANGYDSYNFNRNDLTGGAYGGKASDNDTIVNTPIIFVHGNSDVAVGMGTPQAWQTGFTQSIEYFLSQGYKKSEMYITTYGDGNPNNAYTRIHDFATVQRLRKFFEAVMAYTGAKQVNVIAHSMGVTFARKVIKGGAAVDGGDVGPSLSSKVNTFVGLAGANYGLANCYFMPAMATCNAQTGFYPGSFGGEGISAYMADINKNTEKEGDYVFAVLSTMDDLIAYGDIVWGQYTSAIPGQTAQKVLSDPKFTHIGVRDLTTDIQLQAIKNHSVGASDEDEFLMA